MRSKTVVLLGSLLCCASLAACNDSTLFTPPERGGQTAPVPIVSDSIVTLVTSFPYSALVKIAEQKLPTSTPIAGSGHIACLNVPFVNPGHIGSHEECINKPYLDFRGAGTERVCARVPDFTGPSIGTHNQCADYHWHADINKEGPLQISKNGNTLRLSQGIHVIGQAGVGGTLAEILSLSGKNIDIHATPKLDLKASLDKQWCPAVSVLPIGSWVDSASAEVVGRNCVGIDLGPLGHPELCAGPMNLGISNELNHEFDKHRDKLQNAAQSAIPCDAIRPKISSQWRSYAIKIERESLPPVYLNIEPKSAAFSGLVPEDSRLRVAVRVGAKTVLALSPIQIGAIPLPALEHVNVGNGSLNINLQAIASYDLLKQQLSRALKEQVFQKDVPGGKVEVRVLDVDLYPSKDSVAVGLRIDAKMPGSWFNTSGWVYLSGKPAPAKSGKAVTIENIHFATVVDNSFWSVVETLFQSEILQTLNSHATFDLTKEIDKSSNEIVTAIARADLPGLKINAGTPNLTLGSIYVTTGDIVIVVNLAMALDAEVTEAILR